MSTMMVVLLVTLLICFLLNVPIAFSMAISTFAAILASNGVIPDAMLAQYMVSGANNFTLLASPFFMMAGALMERGGVSKRIIQFADTMVGHQHGGLGAVSVVACAIFAAISGSTPATAAAVGGIVVPEMEQRGYDRSYSSAVVGAAGCLGVIIPPSITMVLYGVTANVSVGKLLLGGLLPGIFLAILLCGANYICSKRKGYPTGQRYGWKARIKAFKDAFWAMLMPIIILGGIMTGIFTPTESACIAVIYGFICGFFIYKELKISDIVPIFYRSALNSGMIVLLIAVANGFGYVLTMNQISVIVSNALLSLTNNGTVLFAIILVLYLILGCVMETSAIILLIVPIMSPVVASLGVDPLHFGVVTVCALATGMATPPVGISLFASCSISKVTMGQISAKVWPFLIAMIIGLFVLVLVPEISIFLPNLLMK